MGFRHFAAAAAACIALGLPAGSASSATIINSVSPGALDASGPAIGAITDLDVSNFNTYDWTFTLAGVPVGVLAQLQASIVVNHVAVIEPIALSLYSGAPGAGNLLETSTYTAGAALFHAPLSAGQYFIQLKAGDIARDGELVSGAIQVSGVPELATWMLMLFGVGMIGAGLRMNRAKPDVAWL
jgi:hypothetical protein